MNVRMDTREVVLVVSIASGMVGFVLGILFALVIPMVHG